MQRIASATLVLLFCLVSSQLGAQEKPGPYDWRLKFEISIANPLRHLVEVKATYVFPSQTGEVYFLMDEDDIHYTEGYRKHLRSFELAGSDGKAVDLIRDTLGVYHTTGLKGTYNSTYYVVMDHFKTQSKLGIDDTPLLWGNLAIMTGSSVIVYPFDQDKSRIGEIILEFGGPEGVSALTPYERVGPRAFRVPDIRSLRTEFWFLGDFDIFTYEHEGDSVLLGLSRSDLKFDRQRFVQSVDSILGYYVTKFGYLPKHRIAACVSATPTSEKVQSINSFGSVGEASFNLLLDGKLTDSDIGSQMGLVTYNFMTFWTPGRFRPEPGANLDWFTTGYLNYLQIKTMLQLGFIDESQFLSKFSRTYDSYRTSLDSKGIALSKMLQLPNSNERSTYSFTLVALFDYLVHLKSGGESDIVDVMVDLGRYTRDTYGYTNDYWRDTMKKFGVSNLDQLLKEHFDAPKPIELNDVLAGLGLRMDMKPSGRPDLGFLVRGSDDLLIDYVDPKGPAKQAGIEFGDILVELRGFKLTNADDIEKLVANLTPGTKVAVVVMRGSERVKKNLLLGDRIVYSIFRDPNASAEARELWAKFKT